MMGFLDIPRRQRTSHSVCFSFYSRTHAMKYMYVRT